MKSVIATWSGGKDSCLAAYKAHASGARIKYLANTISRDYRRVRFHGVQSELIALQARALGIRLLQKETTPEDYENEFIDNIKRGINGDVSGLTFGDIHLHGCYAWSSNICNKLGLDLVEPLWGSRPITILRELVDLGFDAIIVSTQASLLGKEWIGRHINEKFITDIQKEQNVDACGENGEYHTLVLDGPSFNERIEITESRPIFKEGYWFLDILKYAAVRK